MTLRAGRWAIGLAALFVLVVGAGILAARADDPPTLEPPAVESKTEGEKGTETPAEEKAAEVKPAEAAKPQAEPKVEPEATAESKPEPEPKPEPKPEEGAAPLASVGPREMLRQFGIDDSRFDRFLDGRPLHTDEEETLLRILYRLRDIPLERIDGWMRKKLDLAELTADPGSIRAEVFPIRGQVVRVEVERPVPEVVERFEMAAFYRCEFQLNDSGQKAVVYTRTVPKAWTGGGAMNARAGAQGFFLKLGSDDTENPEPVFAAQRVAWYPHTPLGDLGFDVGLLDTMEDKETLREEEREAFYQMLDAVGRAKPGQLRTEADRQVRALEEKHKGEPQKLVAEVETDSHSSSVVPLFMEAPDRRGDLAVVTGEARKVVLIRVDDADVRARFGIDHYYEMSVFTPDSQGNPLIFCVRELPAGLEPGEGPQYSETVRVAGFLLKLWAYRVPPPPGTPESQRESTLWKKRAPLLIGRSALWYPRQPAPSATLFGAIAGGLFLVALLATWLAIWRYNRADRAFHEKAIARNYANDSGVSLDQIGLDADGKPDFSLLEDSPPDDANGKQPG